MPWTGDAAPPGKTRSYLGLFVRKLFALLAMLTPDASLLGAVAERVLADRLFSLHACSFALFVHVDELLALCVRALVLPWCSCDTLRLCFALFLLFLEMKVKLCASAFCN